MNRPNYRRMGQEQIDALGGRKEDILLHCCCAPCASSCMEYLKDYFNIRAYFYNPNIAEGEYVRRKKELVRFTEETGWATVEECGHDENEFLSLAKGLEACPEGGERCSVCFSLRIENTARKAKEKGIGYIATTLTLSPLKNAERINGIGAEICCRYGITWLYSDFKKNNGYLRSIELSKEYGLYRQNYCGCVYSERESLKCLPDADGGRDTQ